MVEEGSAAQGNARQGEPLVAGSRLPLRLFTSTEWLERTQVLVEETRLLHGSGLILPPPPACCCPSPISCFWRVTLFHSLLHLSQLLPLEVCTDTYISSCVPTKESHFLKVK